MFKSQSSVFLLLLAGLVGFASAAPYYYFFQDDPANQPVAAAPTQPQPQQPGQAIGEAGQNVQAAVEAGQQQVQQAGSQLPEKFVNHLSHFYEHGRNAMKNVYENVGPDLRDIRGDLREAAQMTGENVKTKVAPIKENMKPYIDQAQKAVAPYVGKAREEVPKLIEQAGPAISKGFNDLIGKIKTVGKPAGPEAAGTAQEAVQKVANGAVEQVKGASEMQMNTNNIQQVAQEAGQKVTDQVKQVV